jgi:hypothetical protein
MGRAVRYCTKCGAVQRRAPTDWLAVSIGVFLGVVASGTAYHLGVPAISSHLGALANPVSASDNLPTFDVRYDTKYSFGESALDITLTDPRPVAIRSVIINSRHDQVECVATADDPSRIIAPSLAVRGGLFGAPLHSGDGVAVMLNGYNCGDKFISVDIITDHGSVRYRMRDS